MTNCQRPCCVQMRVMRGLLALSRWAHTHARFSEYKLEMSLESQLAASFPVPGGAELHYAVPIVVGTATKKG